MNAVKFSADGGRISVTVGTVSGRAQLVVTDHGEGIDASFLPQLFTRFRQADSTTTRQHGGLGLGLSIAASLVRLHGGEVRATSDGRGKGSSFIVTLPLAPDQHAHALREVDGGMRVNSDPTHTLSGLRLLLIDDESDVRLAVSRLLEQAGAQVVALESGATIEAAIASLRPHVLLIDISMPGEDGYTLIRRIRRMPKGLGGEVPAISLTAHARNEDRARAIASGFQDHLPKPIDLPGLISTVRALAASTESLAKEGLGAAPQ